MVKRMIVPSIFGVFNALLWVNGAEWIVIYWITFLLLLIWARIEAESGD